MKPLAYVSDERFVALPDVGAELLNEATGDVVILRSSPRGVFFGVLAAGGYRVTLAKTGYG